jgi:hypothetical protein
VRIHQRSRTVIDHDQRGRFALKGSTAALALVGCGVAAPPVLPATAFSFSMDIISENPEYGGSTSSYSESLDVDYGDGALSPCP